MNLNDLRANAYKSNSKTNSRTDENIKSVIKMTEDSSEKKSSKFSGNPELKAAADALTHGGLLKVPQAPGGKEDVYRRVAKFLILIGVDQAALVIKHLSQEETEKIIPEITAVRKIDPDEALEILEEFDSIINRVKESGGTHTAQNILEKAFGKQRAQDLMSRLNLEEEEKPFSYLGEKEPERILELLKGEANAVKALVLSYVPPKKAADVINKLSGEDKKEVIMQLAHTKKVSPDVLHRVDKAMHEKSLKQIDIKTNQIDGRGVLAEILKKMDFKAEQDIIDSLRTGDPELGEDLQTRLFTMDDVLGADDRYLQGYLREFNDTELAYLIGDKPDEFREKIFKNISKTRADIVLEEEQVRKPMLKRDCNEITQKFYSHLRHAWEDGQLIIAGRDDEVYV
ncbi:MAG: flagellar motor switch protein FliG [Treponema sp.]|nr:flagellar motor switch protein FliG [Candidatus Treponema merdequi]